MSTQERLLIEILDIAKDVDDDVIWWITNEINGHTDGDTTTEVWLADSDDAGPMGDGRNRVVLFRRSAGDIGPLRFDSASAPWLTHHHIYDAAPVSCRRANGRPDPRSANALRFVAMNCAEGVEDEFHAWYEEDHLPKFTEVPGVLEGRRLYAQAAPRHHLAIYWLDDVDVVRDPRWKAAAGTDWTTAMRAKTFDRDRINLVPFPLAAG